MNITFNEKNMRVSFRVNEDRTVELVDFSGLGENGSGDLPQLKQNGNSVPRLHPVVQVQLTGDNATDWHAQKHEAGSETTFLLYDKHTIVENEKGRLLTLELKSAKIRALYHMQFYSGVQAVKTWTEIINISGEEVGLDYVTSFFFGGLCKNGGGRYYDKTSLLVPFNSWSNENQWQTIDDISKVGLSFMPVEGYGLPDRTNNRFKYGSIGSWSCAEHLPMGMVKNSASGEIYYFQIEFSGSWQIEYGSEPDYNLYVALMGPNDETAWWKSLKPGEGFTTVPAAFGVCRGNESDAAAEFTSYRRRMRRENEDDKRCNIIFNDYMNCLGGDPTEEKEYEIIDRAWKLGCEYYCIDAGWYDKGAWWDRVGEWQESPERFPGGLKRVCDYAISKGLKMGLWLEIEVMGTKCPLASRLPDSWFILNHGKRRVENQRYLLDFRNEEVRSYCSKVVDRLIRDYGISYFKIDYNVTIGTGPDNNADSEGQGLIDHVRAYYDWLRSLYAKYPDLIIENCGSGAQRMDYGILSLHSLQSTSDQTDYINNSYIASNAAAAVTPEQAGMWVYPYVDEREHVIYNMVNGLLLRPYMSGLVWNISRDNFSLMQEGVALYKRLREELIEMTPFWPQGFNDRRAAVLLYGMRNRDKAYLAVFAIGENEAEADLTCLGKVELARVIYPSAGDCLYRLEENKLRVTLPHAKCARLFELFISEVK